MTPPPGLILPELRFDRDGCWFVDGERIEHARSVQVLTRNLRVLGDGSFVTSIGREVAPVKVDDVAFFVLDVELDTALHLKLSDEQREVQEAPVLSLDPQGRLYVRVKNGLAWARFARGAQQRLEPHWVARDQGIGLVLGGRLVLPSLR